MPNSVLILDDDADFNSLLTDIFEQADYVVTSMTDPVEAIEVFHETDYDLVVTDQKMPDMTGSEFMKRIKARKPEIPVIMVSGYLENDTIRDLISEGVGGVFLKPLNIFSLLERTAELIEEAKKIKSAPEDGSDATESEEAVAQLGFVFRSYPCKSGASVSFAERLYNLRNFKSTLSLIGEAGMHFRKICEDMRGFYDGHTEHFIYLSADSFDQAQTLSLIASAQKNGAERVTCVLLHLETMDESQKMLATQLAKQEGVFEDAGLGLRTIFCVSGDLDSLFDQGLIDENLYILMGTAEVRVPPLRECRVDVGIMAQQLVVEMARERGLNAVPRFERSARELLRQHAWGNNYEELSAIVGTIMKNKLSDVISYAVVKSALKGEQGEQGEQGGKDAASASARAQIESHLSKQRSDYVRAASVFLGEDARQVARFYGTDVASIGAKVK